MLWVQHYESSSDIWLCSYVEFFACSFPAPHSFPYVKKRIIVIYQTNEELTPIEVACDAMMQKVAELKEVVNHPMPDVKKLQLKLQGSVSVQVSDTVPWWRHQMETFSALLAICAGNSLVTGQFPTQRPVTRSFDVFFDLRLNKRLSKQSSGWWFEMPSPSLWRHCNAVGCFTTLVELPKWVFVRL